MQSAIRIENLSKCYRLGKTHQDTLSDRLSRLIGSNRAPSRTEASPDGEAFWALRDINLELMEGSTLGVIGGNGAGKSTLLKILSRITVPTTGRALVRGRLASLLEVGTGFHPELTGRENVFLNGTILGMRKEEVRRKFDEIVAFSGVEKFIDTPVKRYSSGMYVRLAFAVAAHLEPDVLIVDEVLAVGDAGFQRRCLGKMGDIAQQGRTVIFVSHNMAAVRKLCDRAAWLVGGRLKESGDVGQVIDAYLRDSSKCLPADLDLPLGCLYREEAVDAVGTRVVRVDLLDDAATPCHSSATWEPMRFRIEFEVAEDFPSLSAELSIATSEGMPVLLSRSNAEQGLNFGVTRGRYVIECRFERNPLVAGEYVVGVALAVPMVLRVWHSAELAVLNVAERDVFDSGIPLRSPRCLVVEESSWSLRGQLES